MGYVGSSTDKKGILLSHSLIEAEKELDGLKSLIRYHCLTPEIYNSVNIATTSNPWIDSNNCNGNIIPC